MGDNPTGGHCWFLSTLDGLSAGEKTSRHAQASLSLGPRTNLPRSRKARLPAPGSAQSSLGTVVSSLPNDQREHPESSVGGGPAPTVGWQLGFHRTQAEKSLWVGGLMVGPGDPGEAGTTFPKMSRAGFRSALGVETRD
nr:unnamed protein product [Rangifer tarandus platyrhynchus]